VTDGGEILCSGIDDKGQTQPPDGTYAQVSAGRFHACAITTAGEMRCWGGNELGQSTPP
jgi:hypothetical protein